MINIFFCSILIWICRLNDSISVLYDLQPWNSPEMMVPTHNRCTIRQSDCSYGLIHVAHRSPRGTKQGGYSPKDLIGIFVQIKHEKLIEQFNQD